MIAQRSFRNPLRVDASSGVHLPQHLLEESEALAAINQLEGAVGIKDRAGLTVFLIKSQGALAGEKITLTIQLDDVGRKHQGLVSAEMTFVSRSQRQFWGYGAEVLDPDGYMNHLWDESTMRQGERRGDGLTSVKSRIRSER